MSTNSTSEPRELVETPDLNGAYPRLDEAGIAALAPLGRRRRVQREEVLFREGQDTGSSAPETSRPGIFAVGDVRSGSARRVATAVGEGAMAIRLAFERTRPG
jgi:hypothetical protein